MRACCCTYSMFRDSDCLIHILPSQRTISVLSVFIFWDCSRKAGLLRQQNMSSQDGSFRSPVSTIVHVQESRMSHASRTALQTQVRRISTSTLSHLRVKSVLCDHVFDLNDNLTQIIGSESMQKRKPRGGIEERSITHWHCESSSRDCNQPEVH